MASMRSMFAVSACWRKSGVVSITIDAWPGTLTWIDGRRRLSRGSVERHTSQSQPIIGTPEDVPVPRNVTRPAWCITLRLRRRLNAAQGDVVVPAASRDDDARGLRGRSLLAGLDVA